MAKSAKENGSVSVVGVTALLLNAVSHAFVTVMAHWKPDSEDLSFLGPDAVVHVWSIASTALLVMSLSALHACRHSAAVGNAAANTALSALTAYHTAFVHYVWSRFAESPAFHQSLKFHAVFAVISFIGAVVTHLALPAVETKPPLRRSKRNSHVE